MIVEKAQLWDCRVCLDQVVSIAYQQKLETTQGMDAEEKEQQFKALITQLQHENMDLKDLVNPGTPLENSTERKSTIEDLEMQLEELEQEAK